MRSNSESVSPLVSSHLRCLLVPLLADFAFHLLAHIQIDFLL